MPGQFTLHGMAGSSAMIRVQLAIDEANFTDYDLVPINLFKGEQKTPEFVAINPYGKIPALVTSAGNNIYESRAIAKYLARKYPSHFGALVPDMTDPLAMAYFDQAQELEMTNFSDIVTKIAFELFYKQLLGGETDHARVAAEKAAVQKHLDVLDTILGTQEYMVGATFGLVDIFYVAGFSMMEAYCGMAEETEKRRNVKAWWARVMARPLVAKHVKGLPTLEDYKAKMAA